MYNNSETYGDIIQNQNSTHSNILGDVNEYKEIFQNIFTSMFAQTPVSDQNISQMLTMWITPLKPVSSSMTNEILGLKTNEVTLYTKPLCFTNSEHSNHHN